MPHIPENRERDFDMYDDDNKHKDLGPLIIGEQTALPKAKRPFFFGNDEYTEEEEKISPRILWWLAVGTAVVNIIILMGLACITGMFLLYLGSR